jgi:CubicO group peptidase (beta-lactamase class C family)
MKIVFAPIRWALILCSATLFAQNPDPSGIDDVHQAIDSLVRRTAETQNIPSVTYGVIQNGEITWQKGYGTIERGAVKKVDENTVYQIASLSKMFTGIIANSLLLEGKLDLDESISPYLPEELAPKEKTRLESISIKDLLLHRSGLPRDSKAYKRKDGEPMHLPYSQAHLLEDLERVKIKNQGTYSYSNLGYAILGYVLEKVSGLTYEALLKKYVTDRYKLMKTSTRPFSPQAVPYRKDKRDVKTEPWKTGRLTPASGIYSNVRDLVTLMAEQLHVYRNKENMQNSSPLYLTREKVLRGDNESYYGMGLWEFEFDRGILYGHSGDMDGFASQYRFNETTNTGFVLLTSSGGNWTGRLIAEASRIMEVHALKTGF